MGILAPIKNTARLSLKKTANSAQKKTPDFMPGAAANKLLYGSFACLEKFINQSGLTRRE